MKKVRSAFLYYTLDDKYHKLGNSLINYLINLWDIPLVHKEHKNKTRNTMGRKNIIFA